MRHFTIDWLIKRNKVLPVGSAPKPFAGRYPTRFAYRIWVPGRSGTVDYCGKPNLQAYVRFLNLTRDARSNHYFYEFDRGGIVVRRVRVDNAKLAVPMVGNSMSEALHRIYHPFSGGNPTYTWNQPWFRKKIAGFTSFYSPSKTLKRGDLDAHKRWLKSAGFLPPDKLDLNQARPGTYSYSCTDCGRSNPAMLITDVALKGLDIQADINNVMRPRHRCGWCNARVTLMFVAPIVKPKAKRI